MRETTTSNIDYAIEKLKTANQQSMPPLIYALWGGLVALGFLLSISFHFSMGIYWLVAMPLGMILSIWIATVHGKKVGQKNSILGKNTALHFLIMGFFMLTASISSDPIIMLLILGFAYCLGAIHIDKWMAIFGVCALLTYVGISTSFINSNLVAGTLLAGGLFTTAIVSAISQKADLQKQS